MRSRRLVTDEHGFTTSVKKGKGERGKGNAELWIMWCCMKVFQAWVWMSDIFPHLSPISGSGSHTIQGVSMQNSFSYIAMSMKEIVNTKSI